MYIDRGIIQNAYISGMREALNMTGNEFSQLNSCYTAGYAMYVRSLSSQINLD